MNEQSDDRMAEDDRTRLILKVLGAISDGAQASLGTLDSQVARRHRTSMGCACIVRARRTRLALALHKSRNKPRFSTDSGTTVGMSQLWSDIHSNHRQSTSFLLRSPKGQSAPRR